MSELAIVICTYDNAAMLDRVLAALAAQTAAGGPWDVLVVDNNSGLETQDVLKRHLTMSMVPGLRVVAEPIQGVKTARVCGVRETTAPWVAFVDDDCIPDDDWVDDALAFIQSHPHCGGFGSRVVPNYVEEPPAVIAGRGWVFAEQDFGDEALEIDCLVGTGMVLNRAALEESGWTTRQFLPDRVGRKLTSGGDVEIALRVASTGRPLWYEPACRLQHVIPARRVTMPYLRRIIRGLGVSQSLAEALTWHGSRSRWAMVSFRNAARSLVEVLKSGTRALARSNDRQDLALSLTYEMGRWAGMARIAWLLAWNRCDFFGQVSVMHGR